MAKSQQTFNKSEREKKRRKKQKEKQEKREQRKMEREERGKQTFEELIMYVDHNGNLTSEKPDPTLKEKIKLEDIKLGANHDKPVIDEIIRTGKVKFFNDEKGYGFITDKATKNSIFVHINNCYSDIKENHKVQFEIEQGQKGPVAVKVIQLQTT